MQDIHREIESIDPLEEYVKRADVLAKADYDANYRLIIAAKDVRNIPAADVAPVVHAEWVTAGTDITERVVCSHCRSAEGSFLRPPICNQCGARMDGGVSDGSIHGDRTGV